MCGNEDLKYVGNRNGELYCRKCIGFLGEPVDLDFESHTKNGHLEIKYKLTKEQNRVSKEVLENYRKGLDTLIYAVCGAGKTELVYRVIEYALKRKEKVGFAIPRRDVVAELGKRIKSAFKNYDVTTVFGGNTSILEGDIICLTTHQLFRYKNYFDLLVVDEIDAFPYAGNQTLISILNRSVKGNKVMMSATPTEDILKEFSKKNKRIVKLRTRYHGDPIPVPIIRRFPRFVGLFFIINKIKRYRTLNKPLLVFCPTISECENTYNFVKIFAKGGYYVHSKLKNRSEVIEKFRNGYYKYLITTAVLERGVTLFDLQVIILHADSYIYSKEALIQIAGRVGRSIGATKGDVYFAGFKKTKEMVEAISTIEEDNSTLQNML